MAFQWPPFIPVTGSRQGFTYLPHYVHFTTDVSGNQLKITFGTRWSAHTPYIQTVNGVTQYSHPMAGYDQYAYAYPLSTFQASMTSVSEYVGGTNLVGREGTTFTSANGVIDNGGGDTLSLLNNNVDYDFGNTQTSICTWYGISGTPAIVFGATDVTGTYALEDAVGILTATVDRCMRMRKISSTKYILIYHGDATSGQNVIVRFRYSVFDTVAKTFTTPAMLPIPETASLESGFEIFDAGEGYYYFVYVISGNLYIRGMDCSSGTPVFTGLLGGSGTAAFNSVTGGLDQVSGVANSYKRYVPVGTDRVIAFMAGARFVRMTFTQATKATPTIATSIRTSTGNGPLVFLEFDPTDTSQFYLMRWKAETGTTVSFSGEYVNVLGDISSNFQGYQVIYSLSAFDYEFYVAGPYGGSAARGEGHLSLLGVYYNRTNGSTDYPTSSTFAFSCWHTPVTYELGVNAASSYTAVSQSNRVVIASRTSDIVSGYSSVAIGLALPSFYVDRFAWDLAVSTVYSYNVDIVSTYTSVSLVGFPIQIIEALPLVQYWTNTGHTWMDDFMTYLNQDRFAVGLPRYKTWGEDGLYVTRRDIAQLHADNMARLRIYAHENVGLPTGQKTIVERGDLMPASGLAENLILAPYFYLPDGYTNNAYPPNGVITAYAAWLGWHNSPGHYANMTMNWGEQNDIVYSVMGVEEGRYPTNLADQPWLCYYLCNNFVALETLMFEIPLEQYWDNSGALITALEQTWSNDAWVHVATRHEVKYSVRVAGPDFSAMWGCRVSAEHTVPVTYSAAAQHMASYEQALPIPQKWAEFSYAIKNTTQVVKQFETPYVLRVSRHHEAPHALLSPVRNSHESGYRIRDTQPVAQQHEVSFSALVASSYEVRYALLAPVQAEHDSGYRIRDTGPVATQHEASYALRIAGASEGSYALLKSISNQHEAGFGIYDTQPVRQSHEAEFSLRVAKSNQSTWTINTTVRGQHEAKYGDVVPVRTQAQIDYALLQNNPITVEMTHYYAMQDYAAQIIASNVVTLILPSGQQVRVDDGVIDNAAGDVGYSFECSIADVSTYASINEDDPIVVNFCGELYNFFVSGKSMTRDGPAQVSMRITADNAVVRTGQPYAQEIDYIQEADTMASVLVDDLVSIDFDYEIVDWLILGGRLQVAGATALEAITQIAEATGGVVDGTPTGRMRLRYPYPWPMNDLGSASVDQHYADSYDNLSVSVTTEYRDGADRFRVREGDSAFADVLEWVPDEKQTDPVYQTGIVKAYLSPYRTTAILTHLGNAAYVIPVGEETETHEELVEFNEGVGNTQRPIESLLSVDWYTANMGSPAYTPFSTLLNVSTTVNNGYGLAKVRYNTKHLTARAGGIPATVESGEIGPASSYAYFLLEEPNG